jgi:WD40 repeat protein
MICFNLPAERIDYLQLAFAAAGSGLVTRWGTQFTPYTVATWDAAGTPSGWQLTGAALCLSPDGEWVSVFDKGDGKVRITRVGEQTTAVVDRGKGAENVWTAVAPGGTEVAWKDGVRTLVLALPGGEPVARVRSGWGFDLRFSPGGRWLTEKGERVFRVLDRTGNYRVRARIATPRFVLAEVTDGLTAVVTAERGAVAVWDLSSKSATATLPVGGSVSALAISASGRRILTGNTSGEVALWDAAGARLQRYDWGIKVPIAATFARDEMRAAVGGNDGRIVVWDLDD